MGGDKNHDTIQKMPDAKDSRCKVWNTPLPPSHPTRGPPQTAAPQHALPNCENLVPTIPPENFQALANVNHSKIFSMHMF